MITDKRSQIILFFLLFVVFISSLFLIYYFSQKDKEFKYKIYPNIFIDKINFGKQTKEQIIAFFEKKNDLLKKVNITVLLKDNIEATFSGQTLNLQYPSQAIADRAFLIGRGTGISSKLYQKLSTILNISSFTINSDIEYDKHTVDQLLSDLQENYNLPAKNALFKFEDDRVINFRKEEKGQEINSKKYYEDFAKLIMNLKNKGVDSQIIVSIDQLNPEITLSEANSFGIEELIGEGVSDYSHSDQDRIFNLTLATSKFNGVLIPKGKDFSFNESIGEISKLTGYKQGYIIKGGKTILDDGGGVCQVSTTFFRAALNAGLPVIERNAHAYRVSYYENDAKPGFDATIYPPSVDLKVKNDTPAYILIQTEIIEDKNLIYFRLYGKKDNRTSDISNIKLEDVSPPPDPSYQDSPVLKKGTTKQIEIGRWGGKASFDYKVKREGSVIYEKTFVSNYRPWRAVYLVGTAD